MANETGSGEDSCSDGFISLEPSTTLCILLSAFGGLLEVSSTMVLAYPEHKAKLGKLYSKCQQRLHLVVNLLLMAVASIAYIIGSWFGPVSLSVPTVMVSKLMFNLIIIGVVLRMDNFSKNQRVGTYCIACAILTLPDVGPTEQVCPDVVAMVQEPYAIVWEALLFAVTIACCGAMVLLKRRVDAGTPASESVSLLVYVTAQVTSAVIGTSVSKMFALTDGVFLYTLVVLAIIFAVINVVSLILAATAVDQAIFVPMQTCATLVTNMLTGLIVWQDWRFLDTPMAYVMVHFIMLLGIWLLSPEDAIAQYKGAVQFHPDTQAGLIHGDDYHEIETARGATRRRSLGLASRTLESTAPADGIYLSGLSMTRPPPPTSAGAMSRGRLSATVSVGEGIDAVLRHVAVSQTAEEKNAWRRTFSASHRQSSWSLTPPVPLPETGSPPVQAEGSAGVSLDAPERAVSAPHAHQLTRVPSSINEEVASASLDRSLSSEGKSPATPEAGPGTSTRGGSELHSEPAI